MDEQVFADGIGAISVIGGTVRLDLVVLSPTERDAKGQPKAVFQQRVIMSMEGFLRSGGKIQEAIQALSKMSGGSQVANLDMLAGRPDRPASEPAQGAECKTAAPKRTGASKPPFP